MMDRVFMRTFLPMTLALMVAPGADVFARAVAVSGRAAAPGTILYNPVAPGVMGPSAGLSLTPMLGGSPLLGSVLPSLSAVTPAAPTLTASLPATLSAPLAAGPLAAVRAPGLTASAVPLSPRFTAPAAGRAAFPAPKAEALRSAGMTSAAALSSEMRPLAEPEGRTKAASTLGRVFDGIKSRSASISPVSASVVAPRKSALLPAAAAREETKTSVPAAISRKTSGAKDFLRGAWNVLKKVAAVGFGLYGGLQVGDILYSLALNPYGWIALVGLSAALAGLTFWLRRSALKKGKASLFYSSGLATLTLTAFGQLVWDVSGSAALGLALGALAGILAALAASGVRLPVRKKD